MEARLNHPPCIGRFGRVSPSIVAAERGDRQTKRNQTSFKDALDAALDELDTQAEEGQLSSGAYMHVAKRMKAVYDARSGSREEGIRYGVIKMVLEDAYNLPNVPDEVDWTAEEFVEDLLLAASEKLHASVDESKHIDMKDWIRDVIEIYLAPYKEDFVTFWGVLDLLTRVLTRTPARIARIFAPQLGKVIVDIADDAKLSDVEPSGCSTELKEFWIDKFSMFPSDYLFQFMSILFDKESSTVGNEFRNKLRKKIARGLKRRCVCENCNLLFGRVGEETPS